MTEHDENMTAVLSRLEKIEKILERIEAEDKKDAIQQAEFTVRWEHLMKEHNKIQEHVKENWERLNRLEYRPTRDKAQMWDTMVGKVFMLAITAIATAALTHIPTIIGWFTK
jgi:hemerythrin-like domain-containing protein